MAKQKIIEWKCPECNRVLKSLYEAQILQWKEAHLLSHRVKNMEDPDKFETKEDDEHD